MSRASCSSGASGQRMCRPPGGIRKSSGMTMSTRSAPTSTLAADSTISWIVVGQGDDAAVLRGAGHVGVLEDVGAAIDAGALAVPDAEDAVELPRLGVE